MVGRLQGRRWADEWRQASGKRFWSCGFCGVLLLTFQERLEHFGKEHFEEGQSIREWEITLVF